MGGEGMISRAILAILISVSCAWPVHAAVVSSVSGQTLVNRGAGFEPIEAGAQLQPGDRVLAARRGTATISFGPDCEITIDEGESYTIPEDPQCKRAGYEERRRAVEIGFETIGVWAAGIGVLAGIIVFATQSGGDDSPPASP